MNKRKAEAAPSAERDGATRNRLKRHARELFAERGIENVAVRDILEAAGQRHVGAIGYYFGNKEALVREIMFEGAELIDRRRNTLLDQLEAARGDAISVRDLMLVIVRSTIEARDEEDGHTYVRFFATVHRHNHSLFVEVLGRGLDSGFRRCVAHLRRLLPDHPHAVLNERILFLLLLMGASLSLRESALENAESGGLPDHLGGDSWASDRLLSNLVDACEGIVNQPMSVDTASKTSKSPALLADPANSASGRDSPRK